uniref:Uncharacterized protein n=1 Tax=Chaetoceros debilis TaxID=122233 RepID=A0A7S3PWX4_9STRA|mmetsp:Transcript_1077/g.1419  ORF Transcript_1077/g.1419 Transcript_1077/m.1419 type:complete len:227 (-) Transcript_1077:71-751(-)|eukprot:CAMPEP_0194075046 /NCGR_PEP_ID=MMETSP0149-20130528/2099_1 /TAXON_ID=122233 /ORGANISM="Chaetoceros debilis, Strain MM31A-1" /LENGTH=226 /DNA_ID=CAMNT_0038755399 /DNA_START=53 /DNA_END=733 /DNA_ORIENTATION=+
MALNSVRNIVIFFAAVPAAAFQSNLSPPRQQFPGFRPKVTLRAEVSDGDCLVERLDLNSKFGRWRFLQEILEEESSADDVNQVLYRVLKSFYDHPRPLKTRDGKTNPSPTLTENQRLILNKDLLQSRDENNVGFISAMPPSDIDDNSLTLYKNTVDLLEKLQPDPVENEEDFKGSWDILVELYGRESTKAAQKQNDFSWITRSNVVRLLLHYDFLIAFEDGISNES